MKKPLIAVCYRGQKLVKLANILQQMGYRTECRPDPVDLSMLAGKRIPDLLIFDQESYAALADQLSQRGVQMPVIVAGTPDTIPAKYNPHDYLSQPDDVDSIHDLLTRHLASFSRQHLRIAVRLPGIYSLDGQDELCDIHSLGTGGVFLQTQSLRLGRDHQLQLVIPLLGMKRELEITGQVIYQVLPSAENNYNQGIGIQFTDACPADIKMLRDYIYFALLNGHHGIAEVHSFDEQLKPKMPTMGMALRFS
ncbi:MAG: PilZ domain-containing protein [Desulfuromonadales bacterium]|nr:PilZ domain-containing protein [Desulfuromonadales bacterium]MDT8422394.1 PilZ domain-containing protein [Desulfuromonadales bacterium]